jgi:small multidrug resistance pump
MNYQYLAITIIAEVVATSALKATEDFTKFAPSIIVIIGYCTAFYFLTLSLKTIPVGIAYAIWAGLGIVLVAIATAVIYKEIPDGPAIFGIGLIISGVLVINLCSSTASH